MKLFKLFIVLACMVAATLHVGAAPAAEQPELYGLLIVLKSDGQRDYFALDTKPVLTYEGSTLMITTPEATTTYSRGKVAGYYFDEITGVDAPSAEASGIDVRRISRDQWTVGGQNLRTVAAYDTLGRMLVNFKSNGAETVTVDFTGSPEGIYLIVVNETQTIKIAR